MTYEVRELGTAEREARIAEILDLYQAVGWVNYTSRPAMVRAALTGSLAVWGAFAGERLVGLARAVGDGASIVFLQDVVVAPELHRRGIGSALVRAVLERFGGVYQTELLTDDGPGTCAFYESLGFSRAERLGCVAYVRFVPAG